MPNRKTSRRDRHDQYISGRASCPNRPGLHGDSCWRGRSQQDDRLPDAIRYGSLQHLSGAPSRSFAAVLGTRESFAWPSRVGKFHRCRPPCRWTWQSRTGIGFAGILGRAPQKMLSASNARSQIARTRADFDRFSESCENWRTEWWSGRTMADIAVWLRTWHARRPCLHWPTSTKFADNCSRQGPGVRCEEISRCKQSR